MILVWKYSRFARSRQDSIFYKSLLRRECGIDVISITEPLSDDPTSILMEALLEAMDEYYSVNLGQEVRRGHAGKIQTRWRRLHSSLSAIRSWKAISFQTKQQAPYVSMIYQQFLAGSTCPEIARMLNTRGICTSRGNPFDSRAVRYILSNPFYIGILAEADCISSSAH